MISCGLIFELPIVIYFINCVGVVIVPDAATTPLTFAVYKVAPEIKLKATKLAVVEDAEIVYVPQTKVPFTVIVDAVPTPEASPNKTRFDPRETVVPELIVKLYQIIEEVPEMAVNTWGEETLPEPLKTNIPLLTVAEVVIVPPLWV